MITCYMNKDIVRGYRIRLLPTESQKMRLDQMLNGYVDAYNWTLETIIKRYKETNLFSGVFTMNSLIKEAYDEGSLYWLNSIPSSIARQAAGYAIRAFQLYFKKVVRFPKFKSKRKKFKKTLHFRGERLYFRNTGVTIEGLGHGPKAVIPCDHSYIPKGPGIRYYSCTVTRDVYGYWLSVNVGYSKPFTLERQETEDVIGIDLGVRKRAVLSDGTVFKGPDTTRECKRLDRKARRYGRDRRRRLVISQRTGVKYVDVPKTKNEIKREIEYQKLQKHIMNINETYNHTMTSEIIKKNPRMIVLETLGVRDMEHDSPNKWVKRKIREANFYEIGRMLEYKAEYHDIKVVRAPRNFPSSQICSQCGLRQRIGSSEVYICEFCGQVIDRDLNAAINLRNFGLKN